MSESEHKQTATTSNSSYSKIGSQKIELTSEKYYEQKKWIMLAYTLSSLIGGYFNVYFQNFIQDQLEDYFSMSSSMYSWFVLIPNLPNIILPLLIGPLVQRIGLRKSLILTTGLAAAGLGLCMIATMSKSYIMLVFAKTILQISIEAQGIPYGCLLGKWFGYMITTAFTLGSLLAKANSSISGIIYPQLYNVNDSPMLPFMIGLILCIVSLIASIAVSLIDRKYDNLLARDHVNGSGKAENSSLRTFKLSDIKKFNKMYWLYVCQSPLMFGAFNAFTSYLQKILTTKFSIEKTEAGELASIPFWIAFSTPLFGILADKFGKRSILLCLTAFFSSSSALMLLLLPNNTSLVMILISLSLLGLYLSVMCASLFPTLPLLSDKVLLSSAFAIAFCFKNAGTSLLSLVGGHLMGDDSQGYNNYLLLYTSLFVLSLGLSVAMFFYDRNLGSILNSKTPYRFIDAMKKKGKWLNENHSIEEDPQ